MAQLSNHSDTVHTNPQTKDARPFEASDLGGNRVTARPGELLCACCMAGGADCVQEDCERVRALRDRIQSNPDVHVSLTTAFDEVGARTPAYESTTPAQRKRDLDILRELGATPETVRTARVWCELMAEYGVSPAALCAPYANETPDWRNCVNARADYFARGLQSICPGRGDDEMARAKRCSCAQLETAPTLSVRVHHFLCMICFVGGTYADAPIDEDNLYELWHRIVKTPEVPVTLIEGPGNCIICPPCYAFCPDTGLCVIGGSLRDRKKDLDVFARISLLPGDTLPAREILQRIYRNIASVDGLCRFDERRGFEWRNCRTHEWGTFEKGMAIVADTLSLQK